MLHEFLQEHRVDLIARCREKVHERCLSGAPARELSFGITVFLDQLIKTLRVEQGADLVESRRVSGPRPVVCPLHRRLARRHRATAVK